MKKLFFIISFVAFAMMSCGNKTNVPTTEKIANDTVTKIDTIVVSSDTVANIENDTIIK